LERLDRVVANLLFDIYGGLLTVHQQEVWHLYYLEDWSLAEIAEARQVSRAAIHDLLDRTAKTLIGYESHLHLVSGLRRRQQILRSLVEIVRRAPEGLWREKAFQLIEELAGEEGVADV
jgi:predicted DNA-binding protein YlxM (UPF0122 family)